MTVKSKGMTLYTIGEVAQLLGVDSKTARRWAATAKIEMIPDDVDRRRRLFTSEHVDTLRKLHPASGSDARGDSAEVPLAMLSAQVGALERSQTEMMTAINSMSTRVSDLQSAFLSITVSMAAITEAIATIVSQQSVPVRERKPVGVGRR